MSQLFNDTISQFQSLTQYQKTIKQSEKQYDIKIYRLSNFSIAYAKSVWNDIGQKYRDKSFKIFKNGWYQNQRRLYVWFIICFMHFKLLDPIKFLDSYEKYWKSISQTFWEKDIYFLKFQLLNIIKTRGRTVWTQEEDDILKEVYNDHEKNEWNQIAKDLYSQSQGKYFKTAKQCRQRWQNHLNPEIKKGEWSLEEDLILFEYTKKIGCHWASIAPLLHHARTEHMIKNRYKSLTNKIQHEQQVTQQKANQIILKNLQARKENAGCQIFQNVGKKFQKKIREEIQFVESEELQESDVEISFSKNNKMPNASKKIHKNPKCVPKSRAETQHQNSFIEIPISKRQYLQDYKNNFIEKPNEEFNSFKIQFLPNESKRQNDFIYQSNNSLFGSSPPPHLIFLNSSGNFSATPIQFQPFDDRSYYGFRNYQHQKFLLENQSYRSKRSTIMNNQSISGKFPERP